MKPIAAHVLVFDSGVGGLSIVSHLREQLPKLSLTYLADNQFFPYGMLPDQALVDRVVDLLCNAHRVYRPDLIVIACNSASTLALPALRDMIATPIVGVVPAIKPAAQLSNSKIIGLLATPGTIRRDYTDDLIADFAPGCEVIRVGSSRLVDIVEAHMRGTRHSAEVFKEILQPFFEVKNASEMDTVVLACTHFPLIREQLAAALPHVKHWIDSGEAIARRVKQLLQERQITSPLPAGNLALLTGGDADTFRALCPGFAIRGFEEIRLFNQ